MKPWPRKWIALVFLLVLVQTAWADFILARFVDSVQSRGMLLYFAAWVILLSIPLLNRYFRVVALYTLLFLLARGFSRITDEQDPLRTVYSMLPGVTLGIKIVMPLLGLALTFKFVEWVLRNLGLLSKAVTKEEIAETVNHCLQTSKSVDELRQRLARLGVGRKEVEEWAGKYEARLGAQREREENI